MSLNAEQILDLIVSTTPGGRHRPGQVQMARAVEHALREGQSLVVQAPTGTGKGLAYLAAIAAVEFDEPVVVATATKSLQDQLISVDLPILREVIPTFTAAVVKGRSNYVCLARLNEEAKPAPPPELFGPLSSASATTRSSPATGNEEEIEAVRRWAETTETGDLAGYHGRLSTATRQALTVSADECTGERCPHVAECFAERAKARARTATVVITNLHFACHDARLGLQSDGEASILPPHAALIVDEAHALPDVATAAFGQDISPGRFAWIAKTVSHVLGKTQPPAVADLERCSTRLRDVLGRHEPTLLSRSLPGGALVEIDAILADADTALRRLGVTLRDHQPGLGDQSKIDRARKLVTSTTDLINSITAGVDERFQALWCDPDGVHITPLDVGPLLASAIYETTPVVMTSATLKTGEGFSAFRRQVGLRRDVEVGELEVKSPFDYANQGLIYCATHLPDPGDAAFDGAARAELLDLIRAAGGRTLALFTSRRAMLAAVEEARAALDLPVLCQDDERGRQAIMGDFAANEHSCLFGTMGLWEGVSVAGAACSLVVIDRLPFARPNDPVSVARRQRIEASGANAFALLDLPRAAIKLAQGVGRLIRAETDRGAVAILDRRLATARYRGVLLGALPPFPRTTDRAYALGWIRSLVEETRAA